MGTLIIGLVGPGQMGPAKLAAMATLWLGAAWFWLGSERHVRKQMAQPEIDPKSVEAMYADLPFTLVEDKANALYVADYGDKVADSNLGLRHTINFHPIFRHAMVKTWCQDLLRANRTSCELHQPTPLAASEPAGVRRRL